MKVIQVKTDKDKEYQDFAEMAKNVFCVTSGANCWYPSQHSNCGDLIAIRSAIPNAVLVFRIHETEEPIRFEFPPGTLSC